MNGNRQGEAFDFAIFGAVPHDHLLRGRTGALVDNLRKRGFFIYYFEIPPASVLQYIKDPIHRRGLLNFLFPKVRILENLVIFPQPPIFPAARYEKGRLREYNRRLQFKRIQRHFLPLKRSRSRPIVALVATPWWYDIIKEMSFDLLLYDCIDDIRVFCKESDLPYFIKRQRQLVADADLILISAHALREDIIRLRPDAPLEFLPNGVDADFFITRGENASPPPPIKDLPRPIIGFVGSLFSWIDIRLLEAVARQFNDGSLVLVGPVHGIKIPNRPNIFPIGPRPYLEIPAYINHFDVCLIPFVADTISEKVDPIKVYEYLSLGKPVVAINLPELAKIRHLVYLAKDNDDFIECIRRALQEPKGYLKSERVEYAQKNSWQVRTDRLLTLITKRLMR